jgi:hypothetical protein
MMPFASAGAGQRTSSELARWGFGCVLEPRTERMIHHGPVMVDNGAFGCWTAGAEWAPGVWLDMLSKLRAKYPGGVHSCVVPDVVGDARATLDRFDQWLPDARSVGGVTMLALQDGMDTHDVDAIVRRTGCGLFVGGTTAWKEATAVQWGRLSRRLDTYLHIARVNTWRRISICHEAGADSFDGTSATKFSKNARKIAMWAKCPALPMEAT